MRTISQVYLLLLVLLSTITLMKIYKQTHILRTGISPDLNLYVNNDFLMNCLFQGYKLFVPRNKVTRLFFSFLYYLNKINNNETHENATK